MLTKVKKDQSTSKLSWTPSISIYDNIDKVRDRWDGLGEHNLFLQSPYLSVVQAHPPKGMLPYYALIEDENGVLKGKVYFQHKKFKAQESLTFEKGNKCPSFFNTLGFYLKEYVAKKVEFNALGCGNLMLSGQHAFCFTDDVSLKDQHFIVDLAIETMSEQLSAEKSEPSVILLKDFGEHEQFTKKAGVGTEFYDFQVQPNMILYLKDEWKSLKDYLNAMQSKYRVRYKRAKKKQEGIVARIMNSGEIENLKDRMFELYQSIANGAGFNLFILSPDYIPELKRVLGDKVEIKGYFMEDNLVGFTTLIRNHEETEAHFLGFEAELNRSHQLYLNMLYDMVESSIEWGVKMLNFSRTAMEIKSSVGAIPVQLSCYIRHQNGFRNKFLPHLFDYLKPEEEWVQRHPFK